eukprot:1072108-Prymnesium_polylepis.1
MAGAAGGCRGAKRARGDWDARGTGGGEATGSGDARSPPKAPRASRARSGSTEAPGDTVFVTQAGGRAAGATMPVGQEPTLPKPAAKNRGLDGNRFARAVLGHAQAPQDPHRKRPKGCTIVLDALSHSSVWVAQKNVNSSFR